MTIQEKTEKVLAELRTLAALVDKEIRHFKSGGQEADIFRLKESLKRVCEAQDDVNGYPR